MAEVLLAMMDAGCGARRLVVLKRIWPELATDPEFMTMFLDEARLSVRLNHPNVVRTFEVLAHGDEATIAMEYLDGQPLTRVMNRLRGNGELSVPLRLRIVMSVLAGLEHAHTLTDLDGQSLEVVHRDVSPHNVFLTYDGQVKLVDFGVAKTLAASHHTRPGALKGKLAYMAPEQLQPVPVDRRADLFAVGVMLWEMLSGRRLWQGMNEVQIVSQLAAGLPFPPLPSEAGLPPGLEEICERALDPNPDFRYQTAAEMEMDLERVLIGAEDSHARSLGRVVSLAFTAERAERQGLIEASSGRELGAEIPMAPPPRDAERDVDRDVTPSGNRSQTPARSTPAQTIRAEATRAEATRAEATRAEAIRLPAIPSVDVMVSDLGAAPAPAPDAPTGRHTSSTSSTSGRGRRVWLRRMAAVAGLALAGAVIMRVDGGAKRLVFVGHQVEPASVAEPVAPPASPAPPAAVTLPAPAPATARHERASVGSAQNAQGGAQSADDAREPQPHPRRHHHPPSPDEDATLPPTPELSGEGLDVSLSDPPDPATDRPGATPAARR